MKPSANFLKMCAQKHAPPPSSFTMYSLVFPLSSLGWYFRAVWNAASMAAVTSTKQKDVIVICECSHSQGQASKQWENLGQKQRILALVAEVRIKGVIPISPDLCIFPWKHAKVFDLGFQVFCKSFIPTTCPLLKRLLYSLAPLLASLESVFSRPSEMLPPALKS